MKIFALLVVLFMVLPLKRSQALEEKVDHIQFFKGSICDIKVGAFIGDILHDGEIIEVEKNSELGNPYFIFNINVFECGIVRAYASDQRLEIYRLETESNKYSTSRGAKNGMTLNEISVLYPDGELLKPTKLSLAESASYFLPNDEGFFTFDTNLLTVHSKDECLKNIPNCIQYIGHLKAHKFETY